MSSGFSDLPRPSLRFLSEVILYVGDMERAVHFYRDQLGIAVGFPKVENYADEFWVELETGSCRVCLHGGGTSNAGPDAPKVVFAVEDLDAVRLELIGRGVELGEIRIPAPEVSVCDGVDPFGNPFAIECRRV